MGKTVFRLPFCGVDECPTLLSLPQEWTLHTEISSAREQ